jgi:NitT/TauT family transport system substrate-binding protein
MARRFFLSLHAVLARIQIALLVSCLSVAGCSKPQSPVLRLGGTTWPGFEPFFVARDLHFWREDQIKLLEYTSTPELTRAFRNGTIDGALLTLDEALLLVEDRQDVRILLVTDISNGADVILAKPAFHSMQELRGHRIGAETTGVGAYVLTRALDLAGLTLADVEIVPLEFSEQQPALDRGRVDAVVTYEPVRTKLKSAGARQIFDSSLIPGEIVDVLVVRTSYLAASPVNARLLVEAFYRAQRYAREDADDFVRLAAARENVTPQEFRESMTLLHVPDAQESSTMLAGAPGPLQKQVNSLAEVMIKRNLLLRPVDVASLFAPRAIPRDAP